MNLTESLAVALNEQGNEDSLKLGAQIADIAKQRNLKLVLALASGVPRTNETLVRFSPSLSLSPPILTADHMSSDASLPRMNRGSSSGSLSADCQGILFFTLFSVDYGVIQSLDR